MGLQEVFLEEKVETRIQALPEKETKIFRGRSKEINTPTNTTRMRACHKWYDQEEETPLPRGKRKNIIYRKGEERVYFALGRKGKNIHFQRGKRGSTQLAGRREEFQQDPYYQKVRKGEGEGPSHLRGKKKRRMPRPQESKGGKGEPKSHYTQEKEEG